MPLKGSEQPTILRGSVIETSINTLKVKEISVPRDITNRLLFDADLIQLNLDTAIRTTVGRAIARAQLVFSDDEPAALLNYDDPKMIVENKITSLFMLLESAAGVFTVQQVSEFQDEIRNGVEDSARWRNFFPDDKVWLLVLSANATDLQRADVKVYGKLDKASNEDFQALVLSRL